MDLQSSHLAAVFFCFGFKWPSASPPPKLVPLVVGLGRIICCLFNVISQIFTFLCVLFVVENSFLPFLSRSGGGGFRSELAGGGQKQSDLVGVRVVEFVLGQRKLRTDHDCAATGQIFEKLWQDRGPSAPVLSKGEIQLEGGHGCGIGFHGSDPSAVVRLVLELDVHRAAADAARFLLGQLEHLRRYPGQQVGRE